MKYSVSTMFDRETWQVYGENWLRQARSLSLDGYVVDAGLDDDAVAKVKGMGFMCLPAQTGSPDRSNIFEPFVKAWKAKKQKDGSKAVISRASLIHLQTKDHRR